MPASNDNHDECIKIVGSEADFKDIHRDLDSYIVLAKSLKGFKITPKFTLTTSGKHGSLTRNKKMCDMINAKISNFCNDKFENYEFPLGSGDSAINVLVRYRRIVENQESIYHSIGNKFMKWICQAFQELPRTSWSSRHNKMVDEPSTAVTIRLYNEDWIPFVNNLEEIIKREMPDGRVHFLYYICRHGLKEDIHDMVEEITRRLNFAFEDELLLFQVHIGLEFMPPPSEAVFADLKNLGNLGTLKNGYKCCYKHLDGGYGYFANMNSIHGCKKVTYFVIYNGLYHQRRLDNSCTLIAASLMGNATAFTKIDKLGKALSDKCRERIDNWDGYVRNIKEFMSARAEAVMTCKNFGDISVECINAKLDEILKILLKKKILVIARGNLMKEYISTISDSLNCVVILYTEMEKPATKETLSFLYLAENQLIWFIERCYLFCNRSRLSYPETHQSLIIDNLQEDDLRNSTFRYAHMRSVILRIYRHLARTNWNEFPSAIKSDGSINKEYIVLRIYTAYSLETGGMKDIGVKRGSIQYCPLRCLKREYILKWKSKAHFYDQVTVYKAAESIIYPKTVVGAIITSFVYTKDELDPEESGKDTLKRMYRYMLQNKIDVFPTKLIQGSKDSGDHRRWSRLTPPQEITYCISSSNDKTHAIDNLDPSIRSQMNLSQYKKKLRHNPFAKYNAERERNSGASKQNEDDFNEHSSKGESSVQYEEDLFVDGGELADEDGAGKCDHDEDLNSSSSLDFVHEMIAMCSIPCNEMSNDEPLECDHDEELNSSSSFDIEQFMSKGC